MSSYPFRSLTLAVLFGTAADMVSSQTVQVTPVQLEHLSIEQGLSQGFVPSICQDDDGFLWFGTQNGLNRYDGYHFEVFKHDPLDSFSLTYNEINSITAAGDFLMVEVGPGERGLFDRKTLRFHPISNLGLKNAYTVNQAFGDGENGVYVFGLGDRPPSVLARLSWPADAGARADKGRVIQVQVDYLPIPPETAYIYVAPGGGRYWALDPSHIEWHDLPSGKSGSIALPAPLSNAYENFFNRCYLLPELAGATWVSEGDRLWRFDGQGWQQFTLPFQPEVLRFADRKNNIIWYSRGREVFGIDAGSQPFNPQPVYRLEVDAGITRAYSDNYGNFWMGTDARGLRKFSPRKGIFRNYLENKSVYAPPLANGRGQVLLSDLRPEGNPPGILDLGTGVLDPAPIRGMIRHTEQSCCVENGRFWILSTRPGDPNHALIRYDPAAGTTERFPIPSADYPASSMLYYVAPGQVWIASILGLARFDIATRAFTVFRNPLPLKNPTLYALERSPDGIWWFGTYDGLLKAEPDGQGGFRFSWLRPEPGDTSGLPVLPVKSLLVDPADLQVLWIGTNGLGLYRWERAHNRFSRFSTRNGLPDDVVYGILADDAKPRQLWLSTNRGLTRFSPESGSFRYFFKSDGLPDNEFNTYAAAKSPTGELLFGSVNGLTVFDPQALANTIPPPDVHLTGLEINGLPAGPRPGVAGATVLDRDISFLDRIELPFVQNSLVFHFAATDFTVPERNQFAFYLEGAEEPWAHQGLAHSAQYLNLAPGSYRFRVKAANSNGVWNEQPVSLEITILPPWYRSWAAYLAYAALLAGALFLFYKIQLRRRLEQAEAGRLRELDEFKNRFFTNITHEFRTPLTVILGNLEIEKLEIEKQIATAPPGKISPFLNFLNSKNNLTKRNAESLLRLINQMLDLAKLESNNLKINYVQGNILPYLRYIAESLHSLANAQNVLLRVESDQAVLLMDYDPERLLQIVYNLLSNAIKFTPSGGRVELRVTLEKPAEDRTPFAVLQVADTGVGIPAEDLPFIFDRFYQAKNLEKARAGGTGIGLALTRELTGLLGGTIAVESTVGRGTTFTVRLPVSNRAAPATETAGSGIVENILPTFPGPLRADDGEDAAGRPALLIIEDNPDVVEYLVSALGDHYALEFAYNGRAGIEKALETIPDLIVSDVMMPEKDGFEVCATLKQDERSSHVPIVLLTAKAGVENRIAGLRRGADAYLAKPFHPEELLVTLANLLEQRRRLQFKYRQWEPMGRTETFTPAPAAPAGTDPENAFLQKVAACLEKHLDDADYGVPQLSRAMGLSQSQLYRKIKALTDLSTAAFIRRLRLQKGRRLLETTTLTMAEVAYACGFTTPNYFSDAFAEQFGVRPNAMRN